MTGTKDEIIQKLGELYSEGFEEGREYQKSQTPLDVTDAYERGFVYGKFLGWLAAQDICKASVFELEHAGFEHRDPDDSVSDYIFSLIENHTVDSALTILGIPISKEVFLKSELEHV